MFGYASEEMIGEPITPDHPGGSPRREASILGWSPAWTEDSSLRDGAAAQRHGANHPRLAHRVADPRRQWRDHRHIQDRARSQRVARSPISIWQSREALVRAILDTVPDAMNRHRCRRPHSFVQPAPPNAFSVTAPRNLVGQDVSVLMPSPDRERHAFYLAAVSRRGCATYHWYGASSSANARMAAPFPWNSRSVRWNCRTDAVRRLRAGPDRAPGAGTPDQRAQV